MREYTGSCNPPVSANVFNTKRRAQEETMIFEPNNIISRIEWCRLQQQLPSVTREEREGWRGEKAGLVDALFGRDRTAFIRAEHPSQLTRYQRGFEDGQGLLSFQQVNLRWHDMYGGVGPGPRTAPAQMDRHLSHASPPTYVESER